jgi:hypothetical protein
LEQESGVRIFLGVRREGLDANRKRWETMLQAGEVLYPLCSVSVFYVAGRYQNIAPYLSKSLRVDVREGEGVKSVNHVVVRLATVELRMFLSEAPYWSRAPRQGYWTSQRRLAINVISDGKLDIHIIIMLVPDRYIDIPYILESKPHPF